MMIKYLPTKIDKDYSQISYVDTVVNRA